MTGTDRRILVCALGGNALVAPGADREAALDPAGLRRAVRRAAVALAVLARDRRLVVTHGSGPQVGALADEGGRPLAVLDAEVAGMVGAVIAEELANRCPDREVVTLLTHVEVAADDPAFAHPTKPIGPRHDRRLVASPEPRAIVELHALRVLVDASVVVVCAGGGGIPVVADAGVRRTVEAVVDKDLASGLLATSLGASELLLLTDVDAVYDDWGGARPTQITRATPRELRACTFEPGSMAPKVEAACRFVEAGGRVAAIGALDDAAAVLEGSRGTTVADRSGPIAPRG